jgi:hypothetical protein
MAVDLAQAESTAKAALWAVGGFPAAFFVSKRRRKDQIYNLRESEDNLFTNSAAGGGFPKRLSNL